MVDKPATVMRAVFCFAALACLAVGVSLWVYFLRSGAGSATRSAAADQGVMLVRGPFEAVVAASGLVQPMEVVDVGTQVSGQLAVLAVKLGDRVERGQLLAEIDDRLIVARLVQGQAALEGIGAQIRSKEAQLAYARAQLSRADALVLRDAGTKAQVELARSTVDTLEADIQALAAQGKVLQAGLDGIRLDLDNTKITAPVGGVVTAIVAQRGQTLNATQQAPVILRIARDNPLMLVVRVPEADVERVSRGMNVRFTLLGGSSRIYDATIDKVLRAPTVINDVTYYDAVAYLDGSKDALSFGRTVQALVIVDGFDCALHLPRRLLPDDSMPGSVLDTTLRRREGETVIRSLRLSALNEVAGAVSCEDAAASGVEADDRLIAVASKPRAS